MRYDIERACEGALTVIIAGPYDTEEIAAMHRTRLSMQHDEDAPDEPRPVYTVVPHTEGAGVVASVR